LRTGRGFRFRLVAVEPFTVSATGDRVADLQAAVTRVNAALESLIRLAPDQYLWIHDRYRTQPAGGDDAVPPTGDRHDGDRHDGDEDGDPGGGDD
jgi:lauroyl/myristoyl acyltransferase